MKLLEARPLHVFLVFIAIFVNNVALTSPQIPKSFGPPNYRSVPLTSFTCFGRRAGYYADPEAACQAYHMCDTLEKQYSYLCPSYTLFNQKYMVCDHWHSVNCSAAIHYYALNEQIGKVPDKGKKAEDNVIDDRKSENTRKFHKNDIKSPFSDVSSAIKNDKDDNSIQKDLKPNIRSSSKTTTQRPSTSIPSTQFRKPHENIQERADDFSKHTNSQPSVRPPLSTTRKTSDSKLPLQFRQPKQNFQLPRTFNTNLVPSTNLQAQRPEFQSKAATEQTIKNFQLSTTENSFRLPNFPPTTPSSNFLSHPIHDKKTFEVHPRGSGKRIKFDQVSDNDLNHHVINGIKFRPLIEKPRNPFIIDKRNFTVPPNIFTFTSAPPFYDDDDDDDNDFDYEEENDLDARNSPGDPVLTFLIPPTVESPKDRPFSKLNIPSLTTILVPPPKGPVILESDHQEVRTPLVVSKIFRSFGLVPPQTEITPPRFPFSRPNREFFIPPPGLQPPLNDNSISEEEEKFANDHHAKHKMTMTFPNSTSIRRRPLKINPRCPRCHPAFLKPNQCQPCVIIK